MCKSQLPEPHHTPRPKRIPRAAGVQSKYRLHPIDTCSVPGHHSEVSPMNFFGFSAYKSCVHNDTGVPLSVQQHNVKKNVQPSTPEREATV